MNEKVCIYCAKLAAITEDHLPTKNLFSDPKVVDFYKIPSCKGCNNGLSKDEEFFRNLICNFGLEKTQGANLLFQTKILRSITRNPSLAHKLFANMSLVNIYTEEGASLGPKTKIIISVDDRKRIDNVITKYVKGLFYIHFKELMPETHVIKIVWPITEKEILDLVKKIKPARNFLDVFAYGFVQAEQTNNVIWLLSFFKTSPFFVFTIDRRSQ